MSDMSRFVEKGSVWSTGPVSNMKLLLHRSFVFELQVTISQAGIAAQTLPVTLSIMQGSEQKEIKITLHDCAQSRDEPSAFSTNGTLMLSSTSECAYNYTSKATQLMRQSAVFNLN